MEPEKPCALIVAGTPIPLVEARHIPYGPVGYDHQTGNRAKSPLPNLAEAAT
jgi:hypothetical protein